MITALKPLVISRFQKYNRVTSATRVPTSTRSLS